MLSWIISASSLKQKYAGRHVTPPTHYPDSGPTSLWFLLNAVCFAGATHTNSSPWFDPT